MVFQIKLGNIAKAKATFIVNASNTELILGSGVSKAFRQRCGGSFYQQKLYKIKEEYLKKNMTIQQGDVIISDSGVAKNFIYALHVAIMNYTDDTNAPFPTYNHLKKSLQQIIRMIEEIIVLNDIKNPSIALPFLGCGTGNLKKEKVFFTIKNTFQSRASDIKVMLYCYNFQEYLKFTIIDTKNKYFKKKSK